MAYLSLYRKFRSGSFAEVIGQEHVTRVLQNQLRSGRIAHAYLFCGPRGCGKTSTARLLARALNCEAGDGPMAEPCGTCAMCVRIRDGAAIDVVEMDAASETGIDDVREKIIENARYTPAQARFKVYIIDEVHDLSTKAFDSLLKTIEEPPSHVVFVLATTESHKVPITIRSRCQRMDFRRGSVTDLSGNLARVIAAEGIQAEPDAVAAIARAAEGSFRDSLSILEQVLAYTDGVVTTETVHSAVGTVGPDVLDAITAVLAADDLAAMFSKAGELVESGKDAKQLLVSLQSHLRDLLVAGIAASAGALGEVSSERFAELRNQSRLFSADQLLQMLDVLAAAEREIRFTHQHRLLLERALCNVLPSRLAVRAVGAATAVRPAVAASPRPAAPPAKPSQPPVARRVAPSAGAVSPAPLSAETPPVALPAGSSDPLTIDMLRRQWSRIRETLFVRSPAARSVFVDEQLLGLSGKTVRLGFSTEFAVARANRPLAREMVEGVLRQLTGVPDLRVTAELSEPAPPPSAAVETVQSALELGATPGSADVPSDEEKRLLDETLTVFRGEVVDE